jgi:hypothetical protein
MQGVSLIRTGHATPREAEIESGRLRVQLDPGSLCFALRDALSPLALPKVAPRIEALAQDGGAAPIGPRRTLSVGELKGRGGPALRLEVQAVGRGSLGVRWTLEIAAAGDGLLSTVAVENRTAQRLTLRTFAPLALTLATGSERPHAAAASLQLPLALLRGAGGAHLAFGFTTALRCPVHVGLQADLAAEPVISLETRMQGRRLEPGEGVESERVWLGLGDDEASLLLVWARLAGLEMGARAPGRAVLVQAVARGALPAAAQQLRPLGELMVLEFREELARENFDAEALQRFASEAQTLGAMAGATLASEPGTPRTQLAAQCAALRELGIEHLASRAEEATLASVGLIDTLRLPGAPGLAGVRQALDLAFTGQRLWRLDPGPALAPSPRPPSQQERTRLCAFALLGGALRLDRGPALDPVRAHWLKLATPGLARAGVARPIPHGRALVVPLVNGRHAVLLVNESNDARALGATFRALGVDGPQHVFEFWREEALGELQEGVPPATVEAGGSRLLALTPLASRPQLIGTTVHLGMGCLEASGLRARDDGRLELTLRLPGPRSGALWIAIPGEPVPRRIELSFEDALSLVVPPLPGPR